MAVTTIKSRGVAFHQYVTVAYVAMEGIQSIDISGEKSLTEDITALDGSQYKLKAPTGYSDPPTIKLSGFYDPDHATYTNFAPLIATPVATNFRVSYTDSTPSLHIYSGVGFALNKKVEVGKMVMADIEIEVSGAPT